MTTLAIVIAAALGLLVLVGGLIWFAVREAASRARAEAEAATNKRMADNAETQGRIIAEHRDPDSAAGRLRDGSF